MISERMANHPISCRVKMVIVKYQLKLTIQKMETRVHTDLNIEFDYPYSFNEKK